MITEPIIVCPNCKTTIKLTESLAAPLIEATRSDYEQRLAQKDTEVAKRESALREREAVVSKAKESLDDQVAEKVKLECARIAADEAKKARLALGNDLEQKAKEVTDLQEVLRQRDAKLAETQKAQADLMRKQRELEDAKRALDLTVETQVQDGLTLVRQQAREEAEAKLQTAVQQKDQTIGEMEKKLGEAQKAQVDLLHKQRELDDAKRELELTVEKRVQEGLDATRIQARKEAEDQLKLRVAEKEQTITAMQKQIDDLKRRAEQGSQQQGEVQELELEALLRARFPHDLIEPVPKGEPGGDALHRVMSPLGQACGTILWESKRTKNWSDGWLTKLREDQRAAKAEIAIIISQVLPKGVETFDLVDHVWVAHPRVAIPVALALRQSLLELAMVRQASEGQQTKMEMVYQYLTGPRFRQRVQAIVEAFSSMQNDLNSERKAITKQWAKREEQIERVMQATVGMYGDLQGIAGKTLQEIEGLELKALPGGQDL
ncbi:MAG: DUF2130 domain-containing protein [Gammaproteobacteria bacterium]